MRLFLGVDGGQSSTKALIGDETGRLLGSGLGGPSNHAAAREGRARLERGLSESLTAACRQAGLQAGVAQFEAACFGMSGGPEGKRAIIGGMIRAGRLIVVTDAAIALAGATETGRGIIVIAGTGSMAWGRNAAGATARAGGGGHIFGDQGGAFDLVREALGAALRMEEGWGEPTRLRAALLEATGAANADALLRLFYSDGWPRERVASLAPHVDAAALEGDRAAARILGEAAESLARMAAAVRAQLWAPAEAVEVAYSGGVFQSQTVKARFRDLLEADPVVRSFPPRHSPVEGALLEAYRAAGLNPPLA